MIHVYKFWSCYHAFLFFFIKKYFFSLKVVSCNVILCIDCKRILEKENGLTEHDTMLYEVGAEFVLGTI